MLGKLVSYFLNDIIVHTLANSKRFQGFALKIDSAINKNKKVITEDYMKSGEKVLNENLSKVKESKVGVFASTFMAEMKKELAKDAAAKNKVVKK